MRIARSNYNPPIYSNIGADLVQEARVVERQKVLNELRSQITALPTTRRRGSGYTYYGDEDVRTSEYRTQVLRLLDAYEKEEN